MGVLESWAFGSFKETFVCKIWTSNNVYFYVFDPSGLTSIHLCTIKTDLLITSKVNVPTPNSIQMNVFANFKLINTLDLVLEERKPAQ